MNTKQTNFKIDHAGKAIRITKAFERKLNQGESESLNILAEVKKVFTDYRVVANKVKVNPNKQTHKGLTLDRMDFCIRRITNNDKKSILDFAEVKDNFRDTSAYYTIVKKWFLSNYPEYNEYLLKELTWQGETLQQTIPFEQDVTAKEVKVA